MPVTEARVHRLGDGTVVQKVVQDAQLTDHEQALAQQLLERALHPEVHRLLVLFPIKQLSLIPQKATAGIVGLSLAMRLEAGRQYQHPTGAYVAQHQADEASALWAALHYKFGLHILQRAAALASWSKIGTLEAQYQAACEHHTAVSSHALSNPEAYFAETLAAAALREESESPLDAIFRMTFDL